MSEPHVVVHWTQTHGVKDGDGKKATVHFDLMSDGTVRWVRAQAPGVDRTPTEEPPGASDE